MSPKTAAEFGKQWPALQGRLRTFLRAKGVPPAEVDDYVQEVAARLVSFWPKIDRDRPIWPLAVTIALNLLRDRSRRVDLEVLGELPDRAGSNDVAEAGIARLELAAVVRAMESLTPSQRAALLQAIFPDDEDACSTSAEKMLRLRARRRLANAIGRACGGLTLKTRRLADSIHGFFSRAEAVTQALACATCLFVASAGSVLYVPYHGYESKLEIVTPPTLSATSGDVVPAGTSFASMSGERLSPGPASSAVSRGTDMATGKQRRSRGDRPQSASSSTGSSSRAPAAGLAVSDPPAIPGNPPVPAPGAPPAAPDQPVEAPDVSVGSPPSNEPPEPPAGDAPIETVEEVTTLVEEATR